MVKTQTEVPIIPGPFLTSCTSYKILRDFRITYQKMILESIEGQLPEGRNCALSCSLMDPQHSEHTGHATDVSSIFVTD